jgi:hypothetical protein
MLNAATREEETITAAIQLTIFEQMDTKCLQCSTAERLTSTSSDWPTNKAIPNKSQRLLHLYGNMELIQAPCKVFMSNDSRESIFPSKLITVMGSCDSTLYAVAWAVAGAMTLLSGYIYYAKQQEIKKLKNNTQMMNNGYGPPGYPPPQVVQPQQSWGAAPPTQQWGGFPQPGGGGYAPVRQM